MGGRVIEAEGWDEGGVAVCRVGGLGGGYGGVVVKNCCRSFGKMLALMFLWGIVGDGSAFKDVGGGC